MAFERGKYEQAQALFEESLALRRKVGDKRDIAISLSELARVARTTGSYTALRIRSAERRVLEQELGDRRGVAASLEALACAEMAEGNIVQAAQHYWEALGRFEGIGDVEGVTACLEGCAVLESERGNYVQAVRILGRLDMLRASVATLGRTENPSRIQATIVHIRTQLGDAAFDAAWSQGQAMGLKEVFASSREQVPAALTSTPDPSSTVRRRANVDANAPTAREVEVLRLVAQGLSDRAIAQQLGISPRTVNGHLSAIYRKLGVTSRTAAARRALEQHLV